MAPLPLHLPSFETLLPLVSVGYYLAKADWRHGFHHATLLPVARQYMGFRLSDGNIGRYKALTFGASQSPALFTLIANEFARLLIQQLHALGHAEIIITVYIDDILIIAPTFA